MTDKKVYTQVEFSEEYNKLVNKMGLKIVAEPEYRFRDDGSYSLVITYKVVAVV